VKLTNLFSTSSLLFVMAIGAFAQGPMQVRIPFPFHVNTTIMPAGRYEVQRMDKVIRISEADRKANVLVLQRSVEAIKAPKTGKLLFRQYGTQYFLRQVWVAGSNVGSEVNVSKLEEELARNSQPSNEVIVAFASPQTTDQQ
jgi:hypothetical protein